MIKANRLLAFVLPTLLVAASAVPATADSTSVSNPPSTYVNANFGPPNPLFNFYRSRTTLDFDSATADVFARRSASEVRLSVSANADPYENSAAYSAYDIGRVNAGPGSLTSVTVQPESLFLSGTAHWAMNLWFDADQNGEYFVWQQNSPDHLLTLGGDQYSIGPCKSNPIQPPCQAQGDGTITIGPNTPLFIIPGCPGNTTTLAIINAGGCASIPANTPVAMWVGIDIANGTVGSGRAEIGTRGCRSSHGEGDAEGSDGHQHHAKFGGSDCDNSNSSVEDVDNNGHDFQSTSVESSTFSEDATGETVTMVGAGLDNGIPVAFTLVVTDVGVLGPSVYTLALSDGRTFVGTFITGDIALE